jgi:hypothetical protein
MPRLSAVNGAMGFFAARIVSRNDALRGSPSSFETVTTQGTGVSTISNPSSSTRSTMTRAPSIRTSFANVTTGI